MTGGGVFPALAILQASSVDPSQVLWIGSEGGMEEELISKSGLAFEGIPAAGLHGVGLGTMPGNLIKLFHGWQKARKILKQFQPDVMLFTGGFVGVPVALASRKIPSLVFIPDIEPGLALKTIILKATLISATTSLTKAFLPKRKEFFVSGYPLRKEVTQWNRLDGLKHFNLDHKKPVLLVYGGSKGAKSINNALSSGLQRILRNYQVIHIWGTHNWTEGQDFNSNLSNSLQANYRPFEFLHDDMGAALAAADLVICRAGASTLGELPFFGLPAILVPYPYAWQYQKQNAQYLVDREAAIMLQDDESLPQKLEEITQILLENTSRLQKMRSAMTALNNPNAASDLANALVRISHKHSQKGETS